MKKIIFFAAIVCLTLSSCKKEASLLTQDYPLAQSLSAQSAGDVQALQANSRPTEVTFILTRGALTISAAIQASGTYTMNRLNKLVRPYQLKRIGIFTFRMEFLYLTPVRMNVLSSAE